MPRRTLCDSAVRPAPPGSVIRSAPASAAGGGGSSTQARMHSSTGATPVMTCPVSSSSWVFSAFLRRSSTGSIPRAAASLSIWASAANEVCTAPKPRIAPQGGLFVRTA
jgi:hypothetical protein